MASALPALVSPEDLHAAAAAGTVPLVVLDASTALATHGEGEPYTAQPLRAAYLDAHVPGAAFVDVGEVVRHPASVGTRSRVGRSTV